jgi:type III secretion protein V
MKISIADKQIVMEILKEGLDKGEAQADITEDLIVALRPNVVEIQLTEATLRFLTSVDPENKVGKFSMMREGLFYESGARYPDFQFVPNEGFKPNSFAFKINHLTLLPRIGLSMNKYLVNDTCDRLELLNIKGVPAINPANGNECCVISSSDLNVAEQSGFTTWDAMGYLVLSLATGLKDENACFLNCETVNDHLYQLEAAFPALVRAASEKVSLEQITRVLRKLIAEEIGIRDLRLILEQMLDYDYIITNPAELIIFDDRLPTVVQPDETWLNDSTNLTSFVRTGMKRYISHKFKRGQNTLIVYLLDPAIEEMISAHQNRKTPLDEKSRDLILKAVRAEVEPSWKTTSTPTILTTVDVRPALREILVAEFPHLPVLAFKELSPDMQIQPIARITLDNNN